METSGKPLAGKVALVTGASKGIGRAATVQFGKAGAAVVAVARTRAKLDLLGEEMAKIGAGYLGVPGDVAQKATADAAIAAAMEKFGRIDFMINNAGIGSYDAFTAYSVDDYDRIMNTNMRSTFLFTSGVVPIMKKQGSGLILQVSSQAGIRGFTREAIYCATKHAQVGFTQALRLELQPFGIKVAVVCPAGVKTEFAIGDGRTPEFVANSGFLEADDVAEAILFAALQGPNARATQINLIALQEGL
jgi:3-oxoacyl-[acyl-carrier protein] reductase